ncbi:hypothetical protein ID866_1943, partial [Astraeus odoratus]
HRRRFTPAPPPPSLPSRHPFTGFPWPKSKTAWWAARQWPWASTLTIQCCSQALASGVARKRILLTAKRI